MWVVKIGGSLNLDPLLPRWLELLTLLGGGRVTIVCGGGGFADQVRQVQRHWNFDDLAAHNMALLAMVQGAYMLRALNPALQLAHAEGQIRQTLRGGQVVVWSPIELLRERSDADTGWDVTADSIALGLALRLNAERLVLVKSCPIDGTLSWSQLGDAGVVDRRFAQCTDAASFPIDIVCRDELERVRTLLLAGSAPLPDMPRRTRRRR